MWVWLLVYFLFVGTIYLVYLYLKTVYKIIKNIVLMMLYLTPFYWLWWVAKEIYMMKYGRRPRKRSTIRKQGYRFRRKVPGRSYVVRKLVDNDRAQDINELKEKMDEVCAVMGNQVDTRTLQTTSSTDYLRRLSQEVTSQLDANSEHMRSIAQELGEALETMAIAFKNQSENINQLVGSVLEERKEEPREQLPGGEGPSNKADGKDHRVLVMDKRKKGNAPHPK